MVALPLHCCCVFIGDAAALESVRRHVIAAVPLSLHCYDENIVVISNHIVR
jgi:hypothetical protein